MLPGRCASQFELSLRKSVLTECAGLCLPELRKVTNLTQILRKVRRADGRNAFSNTSGTQPGTKPDFRLCTGFTLFSLKALSYHFIGFHDHNKSLRIHFFYQFTDGIHLFIIAGAHHHIFFLSGITSFPL